MAYTLQESYDSSAGKNLWTIQGATWVGMTFTTASAYDLTKVDLWLRRYGTTPGTVYLDVYATDAGKPTGASLGSASLNANEFSASDDWREFVLSSAVTLTDATTYALVIRVPDGNVNNCVQWRFKSGDGYASGGNVQSTDSGSTWTTNSTYDGGFKTYSGGTVDYLDAAGACTLSLTASGDAELLDVLNAAGAATFAFAIEGDTVLSHMPINAGGMSGETKLRIVAVGNNSLYYEDVD